MVRKYFIEQVLAKCEGFAKVLLGLFILGSFSACDQEMSEPVPQVAKVVDSLQTDLATRSSTRSLETTSPGWSEGSYDRVLANQYEISPPQKISGNRYVFKVRSLHLSRFDVWIKYHSPKGNNVYQKLTPNRNYIEFSVDRSFQQEGKYYYRFFVAKGGNSYPTIHQNSFSIDVSLPLRIPALGDDYKLHMTPIGYDKTKNLEYEQWYFETYQCTSWVALKINQMWGTKTTFWNKMFGQKDRLGDAKNWKRILVNHGYVADQIPKAGDVIWFPENARTPQGGKAALERGHVGFVHEVIGNKIIYTDYNGPKSLKAYARHEVRLSDLSPQAEFIHVQHQH